jgi:hypothetical protein
MEKERSEKHNKSTRPPTTASSRWMTRFALENGLFISTGNGNHAVHIETSTGQSRPLPISRGDLSPGVTRSIYKWIVLNSERNQI